MIVGDSEIFIDDATIMKQRLEKLNAQVTLVVGAGQLHDYSLFFSYLPEADDALVAYWNFIKSRIC
jgi:acetyl esterase/lipase